MGMSITATIRCDRCEREQAIEVYGDSMNDEFHIRRARVIGDANAQDRYGWRLVDRDGREVHDSRLGPAKLLCSPCASEYAAFLERQKAAEAEFMSGL